MKWFSNLMTRTKLLVGLGLIMVFMAVVIVNAYTTISMIQTSQESLTENEFATILDMKDIRSNQNAIRADLLSTMLVTDPVQIQQFEREIQIRGQENDTKLTRLLNRSGNHNPEIDQKLEEFERIRTIFSETRNSRVIPLIEQGRFEEAKALVLGEQLELDKQLRVIADDMINLAVTSAEAAVIASAQQAQKATGVFVVAGALALLFCGVMVLVLNHVIAVPLREISNVAEKIAYGDLTMEFPAAARSDEVGLLKQSFQKMVVNLRQVMQEIREGTNVLASAAGEIVATTTQVASGAAETATAITETTATVEEVKKTAELSSDKARYVSDTAQKAAQVSQTGRQAVEKSIEGVNQVRRQMETLAESIVELSEQSQAIAEIIATVNDLAEQSNLLAVNAAIEAAKAGEQGKGFGVVAQEIKSLAEQSKQATAQVRGILGNIQKATSASVLAAEQGSKSVEAGVKQTMEAGEAIKVLAQSIVEAAQAATQIAASSRQQQVGMDQVALAIENIRQASAQNVAGTKQAETAAHDLSGLGQKLKVIIEQYHI